jgi:hypothetical protein
VVVSRALSTESGQRLNSHILSAAIRFVLSDMSNNLRAEDRQAILHVSRQNFHPHQSDSTSNIVLIVQPQGCVILCGVFYVVLDRTFLYFVSVCFIGQSKK